MRQSAADRRRRAKADLAYALFGDVASDLSAEALAKAEASGKPTARYAPPVGQNAKSERMRSEDMGGGSPSGEP